MQLILPEVWNLSVELVATFSLFIVAAVWAARSAYGRVMGAIAELKVRLVGIEERNREADLKEAELARRLQLTETAQAVQTAQMTSIMQAVERMDRNIVALTAILTEGKK